MKKLLILLFSILISFNSYGGWTEISQNSAGYTYYLDKDTIKKDAGYVYWWEMNSSPKLDDYGHRSSQIYRQGDCGVFRDKPMSYVYFRQSMGKGEFDYISTPEDPKWFFPLPGSVSEIILNFVCDYVN